MDKLNSTQPAQTPTAAGAPLTDLAQQYLDLLLASKRQQASQLILDAVEEGTSVKEIYLDVFQSTQREIGRLWQTNEIGVAQEHYCTAATQLIMSQLYSHIFTTEKNGYTLVSACVGGELHEIGARMVADFFEMDGWDTFFLGANTPTSAVLQAVEERQADVLGISATMTYHVQAVQELIAAVRDAEPGREPAILVGGYPFNVTPALWQEVDADGYARDAQQAVVAAAKLVQSGGQQ